MDSNNKGVHFVRKRRIISALLIAACCFCAMGEAQASEIKDAEKKIEKAKKQEKQLKEDQKKAEAEKNKLTDKLDQLLGEIGETEEKIAAKEEEIFAKEEELFQAQADENDQYEDMKKRIKYMYESGNSQFVEILCESKDLSDFLNRTEYISTISNYDRDMLKKFQGIVKKVQDQEAVLKEEQKEMEIMQNELIEKQNQLEEMLDDKNAEIAGLKSEIQANEQKMKKLEEAKKAAEEAARKKAEAEAAKRAAEAAAAGNVGAGEAVVSGNGFFTHPCPGYTRISSTFGYRKAPLAGASTNHKGMDFAAPTGTPIYAAAAGTVTSAGYSGKAGNLLIINHGNGLLTYYMHCNKIYVSAGQKVEKGQNVAAVGTTGNSTGPHLHFQVMVGGTPVNPLQYL